MNARPHPCPCRGMYTWRRKVGGRAIQEAIAVGQRHTRGTIARRWSTNSHASKQRRLLCSMQACVYWCCVWRAAAGEASKGWVVSIKGGEVGLPVDKEHEDDHPSGLPGLHVAPAQARRPDGSGVASACPGQTLGLHSAAARQILLSLLAE